MKPRYEYKSEDMLVTRVRSRDNDAMRLAIAFHKRMSIGSLIKIEDERRPWRYVYRTTAEFDKWADTFLGLPGLSPRVWSDDPQHAGIEDLDHDAFTRAKFMKERGPKRDILILDTEDQIMLFKMRWQDAD